MKEPWEMTYDEFDHRGYDPEMVDKLRVLPKRQPTEREVAAAKRVEAASEALTAAHLGWVFSSPKHADTLKGKSLKLWKEWNNAVNAEIQISKELRKDLQGHLHREAIKKAMAEGKEVPPEVLKDYPDLMSKAIDDHYLKVHGEPYPKVLPDAWDKVDDSPKVTKQEASIAGERLSHYGLQKKKSQHRSKSAHHPVNTSIRGVR